jgi:hypothetical protein
MDDNKFKGWKESVFKPLLTNIIGPIVIGLVVTFSVTYILVTISNYFL